jgi:hypothetical protein
MCVGRQRCKPGSMLGFYVGKPLIDSGVGRCLSMLRPAGLETDRDTAPRRADRERADGRAATLNSAFAKKTARGNPRDARNRRWHCVQPSHPLRQNVLKRAHGNALDRQILKKT